MWPMLLDMSRDECKRILRRLELEAYASIITVFRAQGALTKEKKSLLKEISSQLNISMERHRAEVRRAVNDEKLATIAEHMAGPDTSTEWAIEGRRLVPLMPRLVPQTAFTVLANSVANLTAAGNARLPVPAATAKLPGSNTMPESRSMEPVVSEGSIAPQGSPLQPSQAQSENTAQKPEVDDETPTDNVTIVPDISIKRELDEEGEEETKEKCSNKKIKPSPVGEAEVSSSVAASVPPPPTVSTAPSTPSVSKPPAPVVAVSTSCQSTSVTSTSVSSNSSRVLTVSSAPVPVKITLTSTTTWPTSTASHTTSSGTTQKVIIVSSSGSCGSPSILQRSLSVPMVKTVTSIASSSASSSSATITATSSSSSAHSRGPTSYIINSGSGQSSTQSGTVVTISTGSSNENSVGSGSRNNSDCNMTATTVSIDGVPTAAYISSGSTGSLSGNAVSILGSGTSNFSSTTASNVVHKLRPKPQSVSIGGISRPRTGPIVIPVTPNTHHPLHQSLTCGGTTGITVQQKSKSLLGVHAVKQESSGCTMSALGKTTGGMKILPISGVANSGGSMAKILPKPTKGSSLYVVNAGSSSTTTASQMSVISRVVPTSVLSPSPNLNLPTSSISVLGTRTITTGSSSRINLNATAVVRSTSSSSSSSSVSSSSSSQLTSNASSGGTAVIMHQTGRAVTATVTSCNVPVSSSSAASSSVPPSSSNAISLGGTCGKSNVIVVQKGPSGNTTFCRGVSLGATTKEFVGKVFKGKTINPSMTAITVQRRPASSNNTSVSTLNNSLNAKNGTGLNLPASSSQGNVIVLDLSNEQIGSSSLLNELLHSSEHLVEGTAGAEAVEEICHVAEPVSSPAMNISQTRVVTLEEAVEMFGTSVGDNGEILLGKKAGGNEEVQKIVHVSTSIKPTDTRSQEIVAVPPDEAEEIGKELDVQETNKSTEPGVFVTDLTKGAISVMKSETQPMDIFSTAIASANINLDYVEEEREPDGSFAVTIESAPLDTTEAQMKDQSSL
ncbi:BRCA2-interacting transcriptional repressor EMSY-like isoform X2 [Hetaerina americana]|uniref:BRCA2-interacting transcriptional repressor EMSY-like isoform X2 n=1 Tax=Hetaerina americana TaxID=62018 RepID=UPI003A7F37F8